MHPTIKRYLKNWYIYLIPIIYFIWYLFRIHHHGPFYLNRIDPDYVYLLNGLNCAILDFDRIGHVQHPGTPLQLVTGLFIRITHLFAGQGNIIDDVIKYPEKYLSWNSFYLAIITVGILIWLGKIASNVTHNYLGVIILQCSLFFTLYPLDLTTSYNPDRVLPLYVLILTGLCIQILYNPQFSEKRFAILTGILLGIAVITKIHFLPLVLIPLFLIRYFSSYIYFGISILLSALISFLPVIKKLRSSLDFFTHMIKHDGLYGKGSERFLNPQKFYENIISILHNNLTTDILIVLTLLTIIFLLFRKSFRKERIQEFNVLLSILLSTLIGLILVAKHYKPSYFVPYISLNALTFFMLWKVSKIGLFKFGKALSLVFLIILLYLPLKVVFQINTRKPNPASVNSYNARVIQSMISQDDFLLIEPTWRSGPLIENALIYGNSFIAQNNLYYNNYERIYPNVLSYEGENSSLSYFRMIEADNEAILKSGKSIFLLSSTGRNAMIIEDYIKKCGDSLGVKMQIDTCYENTLTNEFLIRFFNISGWHTKSSGICGFERNIKNILYTDNGKELMSGNHYLDQNNKCNGNFSLKLDSKLNVSPAFVVHHVAKGDYLTFTIKSSSIVDADRKEGNLIISSIENKTSPIVRTRQYQSLKITPGWILTRLSVDITDQPVDSTISCYFEYSGAKVKYIDDFSYEHYQRSN
jgi:hypothetical protein